jgi:hypothetical protein
MRSTLFPICWLVALACAGPPASDAATQDTTTAPQGVVDSVFPVEEEIRRFRAQLSEPLPDSLEHAAPSKEALANQFIRAVEQRDSVRLRELALSPAEFIAFYYPHSRYASPPYTQSPSFVWFLIEQNSAKGLSRVLQRYGGQPTGYRGIECQPPDSEPPHRFWQCVVRWQEAPGKPDPLRAFGSIMERDGRFKFVSYANEL